MSSLTPNSDKVFINKNSRLSVEYAKARKAIDEDYKLLFASNQAMAKSVRKRYKDTLVEHLEGKVAWAGKGKDRKLLVTFPDHSVASY